MATHIHIHMDGLIASLVNIHKTLEVIVSNQEELDARVAQLADGVAQLQVSVDLVQQEVADLKAANPEVDFSGLDAALANFSTTAADLAATE